MALTYPHFIGNKKSIMVPSTSSLAHVILTQDNSKKIAAYKIIEYVEFGMLLGLGTNGLAMSIAVVQYGWKYVHQKLQDLFVEVDCVAKLRTKSKSGEPFETDNKNYIVDLYFNKDIGDLKNIHSDSILRIAGVFEHEMFLDVTTTMIVAGELGVTVKNK
ncbi:hypothetical protein UlMin_027779 [Ulmus minor]